MPGGNSTQQTQQQSSQTSPWAPAQPLLNNILGTLGNQNTSVTPGQTGAAATLTNEANGLPSFATPGTAAVNNLFDANTTPQQGMLTGANTQLNKTLSPYTDPNYTNPYTNPAIKGMLDTTNQDITKQINSQFAGAGRDMSADNTQALSRGLAQGDASILANQYNTNVGQQQNAASTEFNAANATAGGLTQQQLAALQAQTQGLSAAGTIPGLATAPGSTQLAAANTAYGQPYQNLGMLEGLTTPIAGLGGQSSGTSTGTTTQQTNPWTTALGGITGGLGMLGGTGAFGQNGWLNFGSSAMSPGNAAVAGAGGPDALLAMML
jgi:hypothetical protein